MTVDGPADLRATDLLATDLLATALVGTGRAPRVDVEALGLLLGVVPRPDADAEVALLDAAALAAALRAAAPALPPPSPPPAPVAACPPDTRPAAPARAVGVLELLLTQPPATRELADQALRHWCARAAETGHRCPHRLLPDLLDTATRREGVRAAVVTVLDARGSWLAGARRVWGWATGPTGTGAAVDGDPTDEDWRAASSAEQVAVLGRVRASRPARGRELVAATLAGSPARHRVDLLQTLSTGLSDADEPLLEAALDDRAGTVREAAAALLDRLPASRRATRCAQRLAPALTVEGLLRRRLRIGPLPEGDAGTTRDGVGTGTARGVPARVQLLTDLVAAADLDVVLAATGTDPARLLQLDTDRELRPGLVRAALTRRDLRWARALLEQVWQPELAALLPPDEHRSLVARRVAEVADASLPPLLHHVPGPWGRELSAGVADRVARTAAAGDQPVPPAVVLARLHPDAGPVLHQAVSAARDALAAADAELEAATAANAATAAPGPGADRQRLRVATTRAAHARSNLSVLRDTVQLLSLLATIDEAFR